MTYSCFFDCFLLTASQDTNAAHALAETQKAEVDVKSNIVQTQNKLQPAPVIQQAQQQTTTIVDHVCVI